MKGGRERGERREEEKDVEGNISWGCVIEVYEGEVRAEAVRRQGEK